MGLTVELKKKPHDQQQKAIDLAIRETLYGGAKRGGKSIWLCQMATMLGLMFPGNRGLMARLNFTDLQDTTLTEFFNVCPSEFILNHHKGERTIVLRTIDDRSTIRTSTTKDGYSPYASRQLYRGVGDPTEFEKVKGISLGHLELDEPSEIPFDQFLMLNAQLDWKLADGTNPPYMALLASNPEPGWVEEWFQDQINLPEVAKDNKVFIPSLPMDNPHLPPGFVEALIKNYPKDWVMKYVRGLWGASEGAVFKELDELIHNIDNWLEPNSKDWWRWAWPLNIYLAIDHGSTGITAMVVVGIDSLGNMYCLKEYVGENKLVSDNCFSMREACDPYTFMDTGMGASLRKPFQYRLIDPSAIQKTQQRGNILQGVIDDYREYGFPCIPAWNALDHGLNILKEHIHIVPIHRHPFSGQVGAPSLFISKGNCPITWKQFRGLKKQIKPNGEVQYLGEDHCLDCVRYISNSRPRRPELLAIDNLGLSSAELMMRRTHDAWVRKFAQPLASGTYFAGMGFR